MSRAPIMMIHGYGCTGEVWEPMAAAFRQRGHRVETPTIRADERTHGRPPASLASRDLKTYVDDMEAEVRALAEACGEQPILFGHSMGGMISQKLAERGLGRAAVLLAPGSPADARGKPSLAPAFTFLNIALAANPQTKAFKIWKTGFSWGVLNCVPADRHQALYAGAVYDSGRVLSDMAYPDRDPNRTVHIDESRIAIPILVCAGAKDRTTTIGDLRQVGVKYGRVGGTYREYPANAHWLIDEPGTDRIIADISAWLDERGL